MCVISEQSRQAQSGLTSPMTKQPTATDQAGAQTSPALLRHVVHPVDDVAEAIEFYGFVLGLPTRFVDGDRYAALDAGQTTLALAANDEDIAGVAAAAFKVDDITTFLRRLGQSGGQVIHGPADGPHERRVVICDPWGNRVIVYAAL
jgi:predicted enzyme related to lactoylglutathione lyase